VTQTKGAFQLIATSFWLKAWMSSRQQVWGAHVPRIVKATGSRIIWLFGPPDMTPAGGSG
jgi:hypothetical protein